MDNLCISRGSRRPAPLMSGAKIHIAKNPNSGRRQFVRSAGATLSMGRIGMGNLDYAMRQPSLQVAAVCDVYQPHLDEAVAKAREKGHSLRPFTTSARSSPTA